MKVRDLIKTAAEKLKSAGIPESRLEAELFLEDAADISRIMIITEPDAEVDAEKQKLFEDMVERRTKFEPFAYITGHKEFMGLDFKVGEGVLIPRPDTEILVESIIETAKEHNLKTSAEIGIGSGCISISIAKYAGLDCVGTDISKAALAIAVDNIKKNDVVDKVKFFEGDVFKGMPENKYDIIVSNPPYIRKKDMEDLMPDVKDYEPYTALCGGDDGLDFYRQISIEGKDFLNDGGFIFYEIGWDEAEEVSDILRENGYKDIEVIKDLSGLDRVVKARKGDFDV